MQQIAEHIGNKVIIVYNDPEHGKRLLKVQVRSCKKRDNDQYDVIVHHGGCILEMLYSEYIVAVGSSNTAIEKPL